MDSLETGRYEMKRITLSLLTFTCAIAAAGLAGAQATCPAELAVEQKASAPGSDWNVAYSTYKTAVAGVTIFDGPPAEQASLVPDNQKTTHDTMIQTWKLPKSDRGYWLQCQYANTTAQIYRRLPAKRHAMRRRLRAQCQLRRRRPRNQKRQLQVARGSGELTIRFPTCRLALGGVLRLCFGGRRRL